MMRKTGAHCAVLGALAGFGLIDALAQDAQLGEVTVTSTTIDDLSPASVASRPASMKSAATRMTKWQLPDFHV